MHVSAGADSEVSGDVGRGRLTLSPSRRCRSLTANIPTLQKGNLPPSDLLPGDYKPVYCLE